MENEEKIVELMGKILNELVYSNKLTESLLDILDSQRAVSEKRSKEMKEHLETLNTFLDPETIKNLKSGKFKMSREQVDNLTQSFSNPQLRKLVRRQFGGK